MPVPFLATLIQTPSAVAWLASIHASNSSWEAKASSSMTTRRYSGTSMSKRPITVLMAALALLAVTPAASHAQTPTPTPTATASQQDDGAAEAPDDASKEVKAIYTDYSRDGKIDVCDHARDDLQEALDSIEADFDRDFPDFREALEAGIQRHDDNRCEDDAEATATPSATATPDDSTTTDPLPTPTPDDGALPEP